MLSFKQALFLDVSKKTKKFAFSAPLFWDNEIRQRYWAVCDQTSEKISNFSLIASTLRAYPSTFEPSSTIQ
jgi:hypothetical protein